MLWVHGHIGPPMESVQRRCSMPQLWSGLRHTPAHRKPQLQVHPKATGNAVGVYEAGVLLPATDGSADHGIGRTVWRI